MLDILLLYFIGRKFYTLSESFNRNKWGYALLGIAAYIVTILFMVVFLLAMNRRGYAEEIKLNATVAGLIAVPFGLLSCFGVYSLLKKQWKAYVIENPDILDDMDRQDLPYYKTSMPITSLLPAWYVDFLNTYDTLKNDICTYYLGMNLEEIHGRLATCTLLRLDDRNNGRFVSMDKQTENARQYLHNYFPDFPYTDQCVAIAWNGYCNLKNQWESNSVILIAKDGEKRHVYTIDIDSMMEPVLVAKNFDAFFVNLNETVEKARVFINDRKVPQTRKNGEVVSTDVSFSYVDVRPEAVAELDSIIQPQYYLHFDTEGFINTAEYEITLKELLNMTGLDYQLAQTGDNRTLDLHIHSRPYRLQLNTDSDYFDETLVTQLNTVLADWKLDKKFQEIYPYTIGNADQTLSIGFCSDREIEVLRKNRYVL